VIKYGHIFPQKKFPKRICNISQKKQKFFANFFISRLDVQILQSFTRTKKSNLNLPYWAEPLHDEWLLANMKHHTVMQRTSIVSKQYMKINICRVQVMMRKYLRSYGHEARGSPEYVCKYKSNTNLLLEMFITWGGGDGEL
jgi:hypothetical protein